MNHSRLLDIVLGAQAEGIMMYLEAINDEVTEEMYRDAISTIMDPEYVDYFVNEYYGGGNDAE